jgi:hypothetical protein
MKTYFICDEDAYRQRTGTYIKVELSKEQIDIDMFGNEMYRGQYLYTSLAQVLRACQN